LPGSGGQNEGVIERTKPSATAHPAKTSPHATDEPFSGDAAAQAGVAAVDRLAATLPAGVQVGVAVQDRATGKIFSGQLAAQPYYSASVVKLFLITQLLREKEAGTISLSSTDLYLMRRALSASDDNAMDELWEDFSGPSTLEEFIESLGLTETTAPTDVAQWGETLTTAHDVIMVYDYVLDKLAPADRDFVLDALGSAAPVGADGFDQSFGLLQPPRLATVKAKQGWMSYGSNYMLHTTGLLGSDNRYVIALMTVQPSAAGWDSARGIDNQAIDTLLHRHSG
jgi:hypothetical protein